MSRAHFVDITNQLGSSQTLCGKWGRVIETFAPDVSANPCGRCAKVAARRAVEVEETGTRRRRRSK